MKFSYDVIVVGAGHAGCEAACASARLGAKTCIVTMDMNKIAQMSCNPAVGGIAKGQIVREIDALGGQMGLVTDAATIQFRMLNRSKGPAMWSPRAQCDRAQFIRTWRHVLENTENLEIWQDQVNGILTETGEIRGVETCYGLKMYAKCVIITAGTFLNGLMHVGRTKIPGGRVAELPVYGLTESISRHGIEYGRMKTGTPVRIDGRSIHFDELERQDGEEGYYQFSFMGGAKRLRQLPCWILYTNERVHDVLRAALPDSPLYNGQIHSVGPRYCPSIETKLVTFPDRNKHQLFLEPEGENTNEYYLNGYSSSLPLKVQIEALKAIPALRDIVVYRPGYAIEYDYFDPTQLKHTLESKKVAGLFFAGQVNGTTGYEEAAGQGLTAGINAALKCGGGDEEFTMRRDESYIGVLIDDLVTKGVDEPYRMFTSRAEYRILLRQDDADARLTERAYALGLATRPRYDRWMKKKAAIERIIDFCKNFSLKPAVVNPALEVLQTSPLCRGCKLHELISRPQITLRNIAEYVPSLKELLESFTERNEEIVEAAEIRIKYDGYIARERQIADKMKRLENIKIKGRFDYRNLKALSTESRQKLARIDPETLAQAGRIPGVSPSDINVLLVLLGR